MHQQTKRAVVARLSMTLAVLVGCLTSLVAQGAQIGAGTTAFYLQGGKEPPVWGKKQYTATVKCACGDASETSATAYSEYSEADAQAWAEAACFMLCLEKDPHQLDPIGVWGLIPVTPKKPLGTVVALDPGHFAAYLPFNSEPVAESSDPVALALQLIQLTKIPAVYLAGPEEFFGQAPQCLAR